MAGLLKGDSVLVSDQREASQLYNKGNYGYPMSGGGLELDLIEAAYLLESGRMKILHDEEEISFRSLFRHAAANEEDFDIRYLVYRDMRSRGFVVKLEHGDFDLAVYPRGKSVKNSRPIYLVSSASERSAFDIELFRRQLQSPLMRDKELLYAVVDEEGDLTHYAVTFLDPQGSTPDRDDESVQGVLVRDRVFVFDEAGALQVHQNGHYGKMMDKILQLSLIESCHLLQKERLEVSTVSNDERLSLEGLLLYSEEAQDEFSLRLKVFSELRARSLLAKTGFKYGTHFRVYEKGPDESHARYLVHAVDKGQLTKWPEISRAVRLAHGVKKEIIFALISRDGVEHLSFRRVRP
ncbi:MAG: tRNA-intron lyase [Sphaerochaeta sp.]